MRILSLIFCLTIFAHGASIDVGITNTIVKSDLVDAAISEYAAENDLAIRIIGKADTPSNPHVILKFYLNKESKLPHIDFGLCKSSNKNHIGYNLISGTLDFKSAYTDEDVNKYTKQALHIAIQVMKADAN